MYICIYADRYLLLTLIEKKIDDEPPSLLNCKDLTKFM